MRTLFACSVSAILALSTGCSSGPDSTSGAGGSGGAGPGSGPTFHKDVEPLLQKHCQSCHSPGRIAPFALMTYDDAKTVAGDMVLQTQDLKMPPWGARDTDDCKVRFDWKEDARLSDDEKAIFKAWSAAGAPEGDPADAPSKIALLPDELSKASANLKPDAPFSAGGDNDQFRCFRLDPKLAKDVFVNGTNVVAGNRKVVHHALIFIDPTDESAALVGPDGSYDCFGGPGLSDPSLLGAWAPGAVPNDLPDNAGIQLTAGSKLVMQVHYHPAGAKAEPDTTTFQMRYSEKVPEYLGIPVLAGNFDSKVDGQGDGLLPGKGDPKSGPRFVIPANASAHVEDMQFKIPDDGEGNDLPDLRLYAIATHMHYVGTDMRIWVERASQKNGDPATECLIEEPAWDFNWQRTYAYDTEIGGLPQLHTGDTVRLRCSYDNTMQNPFVVQSLMQQHLDAPHEVKLGETTADEMCLGGFVFLVKL